ncbi:acid-sensing ion channel 2-like isoform X1 [Watersipora subatra]|uniref:acid-sensing ion channel 2-like isoform X1 n=1 Tax=Watersipora subatra TaxID=2589382 RepID=UPI00355B91F4
MTTWQEFTEGASMHGLKSVGDKKLNPLRRSIWLLLILAFLAYFCWSFGLFLIDFSDRLLTTTIKLEKAHQLKFPTVTLCNRNMWTKSAVLYSGFAALPQFMTDLHSEDPYKASLSYNYSQPGYAALAHKSPAEAEEFLQMAAVPMSYSFLHCYILEREVNCSDIFKVVPTDGGYCFQFNSDGTFNATVAGRAGGVSFFMDALVDEYFNGPTSMAEGFTMTFHEAHQVPLVRELGIGASPGTQTSVVLTKSELSRMPPRRIDKSNSSCYDTLKLPNPLHFYANYSYSACMVECKAAYVFKKCQCRHPFQPALNGSSLCRLPIMLNCSAPALQTFTTDPEGIRQCNCPDPCIDSEYTAQLSSYSFPSSNYIRQLNLSNSTLNHLKKNAVYLDIFYGKMSYRRIEERLAYTFHDMISSLGGTLGLCVGGSLLTVAEFVEFGILSLHKRLLTAKKSGSQITVAPAKQPLS